MVLLILYLKERRYEVQKFVEKPEQGTAPSNLAIMGRYVLTPEIFDYLKHRKKVQVMKFNSLMLSKE